MSKERLLQPELESLTQILSNDPKSLVNVIQYMLYSKNGGAYFLPTTEAELASLPGSGLPQIEVQQSPGSDSGFIHFTMNVKVGVSSGSSIWSDLLAVVYRGKSGYIWKELTTTLENAERMQKIWLHAGGIQDSCQMFAKVVGGSLGSAPMNKSDNQSAQKILAAAMKLMSDTQSFRKLLTEYNAAGRMKSEDLSHWKQSIRDVHVKLDGELTTFRNSLGELQRGFNRIERSDQNGMVKKHWATMESLKRRIVNTAFAVDQILGQMPQLDSFATACGTWAAHIDAWVLDICGSMMCDEAAEACLVCEERHSLLIEESAVSSIVNASIQAPTEYLEVETIMLGNEKIL